LFNSLILGLSILNKYFLSSVNVECLKSKLATLPNSSVNLVILPLEYAILYELDVISPSV